MDVATWIMQCHWRVMPNKILNCPLEKNKKEKEKRFSHLDWAYVNTLISFGVDLTSSFLMAIKVLLLGDIYFRLWNTFAKEDSSLLIKRDLIAYYNSDRQKHSLVVKLSYFRVRLVRFDLLLFDGYQSSAAPWWHLFPPMKHLCKGGYFFDLSYFFTKRNNQFFFVDPFQCSEAV